MNYEDDELERMRGAPRGQKQPCQSGRVFFARQFCFRHQPQKSQQYSRNSQRKGEAGQQFSTFRPTAVLRALEVEKRVRDAAAAITVNRRATESI